MGQALPEGQQARRYRDGHSMASPAGHSMAYPPASHGMTYPACHSMAYPVCHSMAYPAGHSMAYPADHSMAYPAGHSMASPWLASCPVLGPYPASSRPPAPRLAHRAPQEGEAPLSRSWYAIYIKKLVLKKLVRYIYIVAHRAPHSCRPRHQRLQAWACAGPATSACSPPPSWLPPRLSPLPAAARRKPVSSPG